MFQLLGAAEQEMLEVADRYNTERPGLGEEFILDLERAFRRIRNAPQFCGRLEQFVGPYDIRRFVLRQFPYLVIYHCVANVVTVIAISHASREPYYWVDRLP